MSLTGSAARKRRLLFVAGIAAALWAMVLVLGLAATDTRGAHPRLGQPVLPDFAARRAETARILVTLADASYQLERNEAGWGLREAAGFPIREDRLIEFASGLQSLTYDEARTSDPYKHDRVGLGDPLQGGNGALVELMTADGSLIDTAIIGRRDERLYVRAPDDEQTYRVRGDLPAFYTARGWLDFNIITIDQSAIRSVRLFDEAGNTVYFSRPPGSDDRSFTPAPPHDTDRLISPLAASTTALAITRLSPLDVKPATELKSAPVARHISETFDGLEVDLKAYREPDGLWVTLRAVEAGEGARRAQAINGKAEGWAFRLGDYDFQDFTPSIETLVER